MHLSWSNRTYYEIKQSLSEQDDFVYLQCIYIYMCLPLPIKGSEIPDIKLARTQRMQGTTNHTAACTCTRASTVRVR